VDPVICPQPQTNPCFLFRHLSVAGQVNTTDSANSTTSYTSLVKLNESTAMVMYECYMVSAVPGVVGKHGQFSMRVNLT
jgi:hypothetical protein